jgi:hypothetical protein
MSQWGRITDALRNADRLLARPSPTVRPAPRPKRARRLKPGASTLPPLASDLVGKIMSELTPEQGQDLARIRRAFALMCARSPNQAPTLAAVACAGSLVDLLQSPVGQNLVDVINAAWQATPFEIVRRKAN